jgi:hypothetical protein
MNTIAPGAGQELGGQVDQARNVLIAIVAARVDAKGRGRGR